MRNSEGIGPMTKSKLIGRFLDVGGVIGFATVVYFFDSESRAAWCIVGFCAGGVLASLFYETRKT